MRKRTTNFFVSLLVLAFAFTMLSNQAASRQKILLEQFTGSWCGWCVDGSLVMDSLIQEYPDDIIGVKIHYNDPMEISNIDEIRQYCVVNSYPSGALNRQIFNVQGNGLIALPRGIWRMAFDALLEGAEETIEISSDWYIDKFNNKIVGTVKAKFLEAIDEDVRLNLYICENNITGGSGYGQQNEYASRPGFENHPYYDKPPLITDYVHDRVVRVMAGGTVGEKGNLPDNIAANSEYEYTFEIPIEPGWDLNELFCVGLVQKAYSQPSPTRIIYNSCYGTQHKPTTEIASNQKYYDVKKSDNSFERQYSVKNVSDSDITYNFSFETSERTPDGWQVDVTLPSKVLSGKKNRPLADEVTINAGESVDVTVSFTPKDNIGIGDLHLIVEEKDNSDAIQNSEKMILISGEIESFEVLDDDELGVYTIHESVSATGRDQYFPIQSNVFNDAYTLIKDQRKLKYLIWNTGNNGTITTNEGNKMASMLNDNLGLLITGAVPIPLLQVNYPTHILLSYLGLEWVMETSPMQDVENFTMIGIDNDPVTDGLTIPNCQLLNGQTYFLQELYITDEDVTKPMLKVQSNDRNIGFRVETMEYRIALFAFSTQVIVSEEGRKQLLNRTLTWLEEIGDMPKAYISRSKIDFGRIEINTTAEESLYIENIGGSDLIIENFSFDWNKDQTFKIDKHPPITIPAGEKEDFTITFEPTYTSSFNSFLNISHNASEYDESISLKGVGGEAYDGPKLSLSLEGDELDFGGVKYGKSKSEIIVMRNIGSDVLTFYDVAIYNEPAGVYELVENYNNTEIPAQSAKNLTVRFTPKEANTEYNQGQIIIQSDDVDVGTVFIFLKGNSSSIAEGPIISTNVVDNELDFGTIAMNESTTETLEIENTGDEDLVIEKIRLVDPDDVFSIAGELTDITVEGGQTKSIDITFSGAEEGDYDAVISIESNAENEDKYNFMLVGKIEGQSGVEDIFTSNDPIAVEVYPNPSDGNFTLNYMNNSRISNFDISITNAAGSIVKQMSSQQLSLGFGTLNIDCSEFSSGTYVIILESNGISAQKQVVIVK